ncbi:MAG: AAA family ATPase [Polyangiaceae bacterium]
MLAATHPLYGRSSVIARALGRVQQAVHGQGHLMLFSGEPGIGKSRLAEHVAAEAARRGATVAWGRAWEAGGAPAYWPWIQVFRALDLEEAPFATVASALGAGAGEVRFAAFDRAVRTLKRRAEQDPLVLVLDDLHAADAPTLLLLLMLARDIARARVLVVGAYREAELQGAPELAALVGKVAREGEVHALSRLSLEDVRHWLGEVAPEWSETRAEELYQLTEGNPLFVVEALRLGRASTGQSHPLGLAAVLDERLATLSKETLSILAVASVLGREFSNADVAATSGVALDRTAQALRQALASSIVVPGAGLDEYRFSHVLLRDRLYRELEPSVRAALHFEAGTVCLRRGADPQSAVHHYFEGESAGSAERVAQVALGAAVHALSQLAFEDAARFGRRALQIAAGRPLPAALEGELRLVVAESLIRLEELAEGRALAAQAAELAERALAHELLARAALVYGTELGIGFLDERLSALLRLSLARLDAGDSPLRARVMARLAVALTPPMLAAQVAELQGLMQAAIGMARRLGERHTLLYVLHHAATVAVVVPVPERYAYLRETIELASALDQRLVLLLALPGYVTALLARGDRAGALSELPRYDQLLAEFPQPRHRLRRWLVDALLATLSGDFEHAERTSREAQRLVERTGSELGRVLWHVHRFALFAVREQPCAPEEADALLAMFGRVPADRPHQAWLLALVERRSEAATLLQQLDLEALCPASAQLVAAAEACILLGDAAAASTLYARLSTTSERMFWTFPGTLLGPTARVLGDLARLIGRLPDAVRHYDDAIAFCEEAQAPALLEVCRRRRAAVVARTQALPTPGPATEAATRAPPKVLSTLTREGEGWALSSADGATLRLKHSKGLEYLSYLLEHPGRQVHVLQLAGIEHRTGDAGAVLDPRAKAEYARRLEELRDALSEAEGFDDTARVQRIEQEIDAIAEQLAGAVGLGGRDRIAASEVERARINVQRRLKDAIRRIGAADRALGRYLDGTIKTGTYCQYEPL